MAIAQPPRHVRDAVHRKVLEAREIPRLQRDVVPRHNELVKRAQALALQHVLKEGIEQGASPWVVLPSRDAERSATYHDQTVRYALRIIGGAEHPQFTEVLGEVSEPHPLGLDAAPNRHQWTVARLGALVVYGGNGITMAAPGVAATGGLEAIPEGSVYPRAASPPELATVSETLDALDVALQQLAQPVDTPPANPYL